MDPTAIIKFLRYYGALFVVSALVALFLAVYVIADIPPSPAALAILWLLLPISFVTWVQFDAHRRRCTPCFDFATFMMSTWIFSVPIYLIWTRGWRGVLLAGMFLALFLAPFVVVVVLAVFVAIVRS